MTNLKRKFKKIFKDDVKGGIEQITPGLISGWVACKSKKINYVGLFIGEKKIICTKVSIKRNDVLQKLGFGEVSGFEILLQNEFKDLIKTEKIISLFAFQNEDLRYPKFELKLFKDPDNTSQIISSNIKSESVGTHAVFDGLIDERFLIGWAKSFNNSNTKLWLHCSNFTPIPISCDLMRPDLNTGNFKQALGFKFDCLQLNEEYFNKKVFISFSRKYIQPIANFHEVNLPTNKKKEWINFSGNQSNELNYFLLLGSLMRIIKNENEIINYQEINDVVKYCSHSREEIFGWFLLKNYLPKYIKSRKYLEKISNNVYLGKNEINSMGQLKKNATLHSLEERMINLLKTHSVVEYESKEISKLINELLSTNNHNKKQNISDQLGIEN